MEIKCDLGESKSSVYWRRRESRYRQDIWETLTRKGAWVSSLLGDLEFLLGMVVQCACPLRHLEQVLRCPPPVTYTLEPGVLRSRYLHSVVLENVHDYLNWSLLRCYLLCWKALQPLHKNTHEGRCNVGVQVLARIKEGKEEREKKTTAFYRGFSSVSLS